MRVLLIDVDSTIPNLALMKLSTWYKRKGFAVTLQRCAINYYPDKRKNVVIDADGFDVVRASTIFEGTFTHVKIKNCPLDFSVGGTGLGRNQQTKLHHEIELCDLDYTIYPDNDIGYGFISRGCDRDCYFCVVPQKEGKTHRVEYELEKIILNFKKVKFMDNNFLQIPEHLEILNWLATRNIKCQFNQGLDIRMITEANSEALSRLNYIGEYIFAFDNWGYRRTVDRQLKLLSWIKPWKAKFYVYVNPDMPLKETVKRIEFLRERKVLPYVMRDIACWDSGEREFYVDLAGYANQPRIVKKMPFSEFITKRHPANLKRASDSLEKYTMALHQPDNKIIDIHAN